MDQIARSSKQIGAAIRRRRRQLGISQKQLGSKIQGRQATISRLEAGEPATRIQTLLAVLTALDLELLIRTRTKATPDQIEELF